MQLNFRLFSNLWSINDFESRELNDFAHQQLITENREGLKIMSTMMILLILIAMLLFKQMGQISSYSLNYFWVMALAAHINISARVVTEIPTLHVLGMTLLIISATAYVFIAHQTGEFNPLLLANIALLFMIIPLIPWGMREASFVVLAIYLLLTLSTVGMGDRFNTETIRVLQFFLLAAGSTSLILVVRSVLVRKKELVSHFELKKAHAELYVLSNVDPLTSAWNRRYTKTAISNLIDNHPNSQKQLHFVIFDIDKFKTLNDTFGHDFGDYVLITLSRIITQAIGDKGYLIRIGGDEFILLMVGQNPDQFMKKNCREISLQVKQEQNNANFDLSWGYVNLPIEPIADIESVYKQADHALYMHKHQG